MLPKLYSIKEQKDEIWLKKDKVGVQLPKQQMQKILLLLFESWEKMPHFLWM